VGERASAEDKLRDTPDEASRDHHGADDSGRDGQLGYRMIADDALGAVPSVGLTYRLFQEMPAFRTLKRDNASVNIGHRRMLSLKFAAPVSAMGATLLDKR
jgi:hypothetical protein